MPNISQFESITTFWYEVTLNYLHKTRVQSKERSNRFKLQVRTLYRCKLCSTDDKTNKVLALGKSQHMRMRHKAIYLGLKSHLEKDERVEMNLHGPFLADNEHEAVARAKDFALDRLSALKNENINPDLRLGSISVSHYFIGRIDSDARITTRHSIPFFQWKEDYSQLLVDYISSFLQRTDTLKPIVWQARSRGQKMDSDPDDELNKNSERLEDLHKGS